jgi:acyl transferase domain-containing protein
MPTFHVQPIAIVGIAAALPGAVDLATFAEFLDARRDRVAPVPTARRDDAGLGPDLPLAECALLDRIDAFDHAFFGMSLREAREMDPQQRMLLQLSCAAIWDSGHALAQLRGTRTAVVFGAAKESYSTLLDPDFVPLVTGLLPAAQAGRVAHVLGLRGPAATIDTACSSSLAAVLEACRGLAVGGADWALAGGVRLYPVPPGTVEPGSAGIVSPTGRARSFDAAADGTGLGEGGAVFLLKPLERAAADGDPVYAVILGGAMNHDGGRSNGFAAPSAEAQEELMLEAWRASGVHPSSIGLIEAHGTGTRLGDPIEFQALSAAFARRTDRTGFCVLSSVKSNIGHLDSAAGAAGLVKAVVSLRERKRYASAHFTSPNPLLETGRSALVLSARTESWEASTPRRAGVSSFGLTGTNVHVILEEAPTPRRQERPAAGCSVVLPVAARSEAALRSHAAALAAYLRAEETQARLADLAYVQATGRDHERVRACVTAADPSEAAEALDRVAAGTGITIAPAAIAVLLLPHEGRVDPALAETWLTAFPGLRDWHRELHGTIPAASPAAEDLLARLTLARALGEAGVPDRVVMGNGHGNLLVDVLRGESSLAAAAALAATQEAVAPDAARIDGALEAIAAQGNPVCVAMWPGELARRVGQLASRHRGLVLELDAVGTPRAALASVIAGLYRAGAEIDWDRCVAFFGGYGRRVPVPTALFDQTRCWADVPCPPVQAPAPAAGPAFWEATVAAGPPSQLHEDDGTETERKLAAIWCAVLETVSVSRNDDFFDLGGDSLMQVELENAIARDLGVEIEFESLYDHPTVRQLAEYVETRVASVRESHGPRHHPGRVRAPATHSQRRMWLLQQLHPDSGAYNVSSSFAVEGALDSQRLSGALDSLAARHGILRTRLVLDDGELVQRVDPPGAFDFTVSASGSAAAAQAELRAHARRPFDLETGAARALLLTDQANPARSWFQLVLHHAISDERSMGLLLDELALDFAASPASPAPRSAPALQYADWAVWEHDQDRAEDARYWRDRLAGVPTELLLPTDFPYTAQQDYQGAWLPVEVPAELVKRARAEVRARNGTLFSWLMTGYAAWLARLTQAEDFIVGVPVAGRHHADAERLPGCFTNTLALRVDASGDPSFATLFERVHAGLSGAFAHQRYPFDMVVEQVGVSGEAARPPLVQTLLSLQGAGQRDQWRLGDAVLRPVQVDTATSWLDLSAVLWEEPGGGLGGILAYRTALFEETTVATFRRDWLALIEAGLDSPDQSIHALSEEIAW